MKPPPMIDSIKLECDCKPPPKFHKANGQPFEHKGLMYFPRYYTGEPKAYEARIKNLRVYLYHEKVCLFNSLHKYYKGNNYSDFTKSEFRAAIEAVSDTTGIRWKQAAVKKIEYGCNVSVNATSAIQSLQSYKGKDFLPMEANNGVMYGKACGFEQYRIKGYNKTFEVNRDKGITLTDTIFRWEMQIKSAKYFNRFKFPFALTAGRLITDDVLFMLANDAITKYEDSIKLQHMNLHLLQGGPIKVAEQKKMIAVMQNPIIRQDFKIHHTRTHKKYCMEYKQIMQDKNICPDDNNGQILAAKFEELLNN